MAFENIARKGENADNQHFPLFSHCFLTMTNFVILPNFCPAVAFYLYQSNILTFCKDLWDITKKDFNRTYTDWSYIRLYRL